MFPERREQILIPSHVQRAGEGGADGATWTCWWCDSVCSSSGEAVRRHTWNTNTIGFVQIKKKSQQGSTLYKHFIIVCNDRRACWENIRVSFKTCIFRCDECLWSLSASMFFKTNAVIWSSHPAVRLNTVFLGGRHPFHAVESEEAGLTLQDRRWAQCWGPKSNRCHWLCWYPELSPDSPETTRTKLHSKIP